MLLRPRIAWFACFLSLVSSTCGSGPLENLWIPKGNAFVAYTALLNPTLCLSPVCFPFSPASSTMIKLYGVFFSVLPDALRWEDAPILPPSLTDTCERFRKNVISVLSAVIQIMASGD